MSRPARPYIFDSGPLSHFAEAGWFGLLRAWSRPFPTWVPETVLREIDAGVVDHPHLRTVLDADWLVRRSIDDGRELEAFARYTARLVGSDLTTNLGECGVLALAEAHGGVAVIDDGAARRAADDFGIPYRTTVALLCELVRDKHLSFDMAEEVAERLISTEYRLPFEAGRFRSFVLENDLLPFD